jgi:hypothetical protein
MTKTISILFVAAGALLAAPQTPTAAIAPPAPTASKAVKKKSPAVTAPLTIPAKAVKQADGTYHYVDGAGKAWIYQQTPFGVSRMAENVAGRPVNETPFGASHSAPAPAAPPVSSAAENDHVTAVADGELIRFEKPTPFGPTKWEKKKTDLTADEQKVWDREQAKRNQ